MRKKTGIIAAVLLGLLTVFPVEAAAENVSDMSDQIAKETNLNAQGGKGEKNDSKNGGNSGKNADEDGGGKENESGKKTGQKTGEKTEEEVTEPMLVMESFSDKEVYDENEKIVYTLRASQRAENTCATGIVIKDRNPGGLEFDTDSVITSKGVTSIVGETDENGDQHQTIEVYVDKMEYGEDVIVTFTARSKAGHGDEMISNTAVANCNELSYGVTDDTEIQICQEKTMNNSLFFMPELRTVNTVKTGNNTGIPLWYSLAGAAAAGVLIGVLIYRKRIFGKQGSSLEK